MKTRATLAVFAALLAWPLAAADNVLPMSRPDPAKNLTLVTGPALTSPAGKRTLTPAGWVVTASGVQLPTVSLVRDTATEPSLETLRGELARAKTRLEAAERRLDALLVERDAAVAKSKALDAQPVPASPSPPAAPAK